MIALIQAGLAHCQLTDCRQQVSDHPRNPSAHGCSQAPLHILFMCTAGAWRRETGSTAAPSIPQASRPDPAHKPPTSRPARKQASRKMPKRPKHARMQPASARGRTAQHGQPPTPTSPASSRSLGLLQDSAHSDDEINIDQESHSKSHGHAPTRQRKPDQPHQSDRTSPLQKKIHSSKALQSARQIPAT